MDMNKPFVPKEEFDSVVTQHVIGLSVLGIFLLLFIVLTVLVLWFLIRKLQQLHERISELETKRYQYEENQVKFWDMPSESLRYVKPRYSPLEDMAVTMRKIPNEVDRRMTDTCEVLELEIEKEVATVYGRRPSMSQVLMAAQSYYKEQTKVKEDCPVESIQILDRQANVRLARSTIFSEDWTEAVPTSLLINGSAQSFHDVFGHHKGIFKHKKVGPSGFILSVSGVRLEIPAGALSEEKLISIGVTWDENYMPELSSKQALLSPVVLCQPSNIIFKVPIKLSFPHNAYNVHEDWIPSIITREGDIDSGNPWTPTTEADHEDITITDTQIHIQLRHFTLYTCVGESKPGQTAAKLMHVVAFTGKLAQHAFFKPRLYVLNSYKEELPDIETLENKMDESSKITETTDLLVKDNGNDVVLEMAKMSDDWKLAGDIKETLSFELVWHACHPHCTFVAKPRQTKASEILCEIHAYQYGNENNPAKLKIAQLVQKPTNISPLSTITEDTTEELINVLIILLDPQNEAATNAGDWRALAEKMGCDTARVRWLGALKQSPTRVLLDRWIEDGHSLAELEDVMIAIGRPDAAEEIRTRSRQVEQNIEENEDPYVNLEFSNTPVKRTGSNSQNV